MESVDQITQLLAPGRPGSSVSCSSLATTALPFSSWPVTIRRTVIAISRLLALRGSGYDC
jgi:hypothetical protein